MNVMGHDASITGLRGKYGHLLELSVLRPLARTVARKEHEAKELGHRSAHCSQDTEVHPRTPGNGPRPNGHRVLGDDS